LAAAVFFSLWCSVISNVRVHRLSLWKNTMNRCLYRYPSVRLPDISAFVCCGLLLLGCTTATAQNMRQFPSAAQRALLLVTAPPEVQINRHLARLSPGARLRGADHSSVMSAAWVGTPLLVNYVCDSYGLVQTVWILSPQEAQAKRPGMAPVRNSCFGSDADKPKTDDGRTPFEQLPKFPQQ
jgi:hypothetical protein